MYRLRYWTLFFIAATTALAAYVHWPQDLPSGAVADKIVVAKSARTLTLLHGDQTLKTYSIALGRDPVGPKQREGDGRTPEGVYRIDYHKPDSSFHRALHISYPDAADLRRAQAAGVAPGGLIMVHGIRNRLGWIGQWHRLSDWTDGCIAVTDREIDEIYAAVPDGTPIEIRP